MASSPELSGSPEQKQKEQGTPKEQGELKQRFDEIKGNCFGMTIQELVETLSSSLSQGYAGMDAGNAETAESLATQVDGMTRLLKAQTQVCYNKLLDTYIPFTS
jgi:hypothetical protein